MKRKWISVTALALALLLTLTACGGSGGKDQNEGPKDHLIVVIPGDPGNLSPISTSGNANYVLHQIYEPLFDLDYDLEMTPVIAKSWEQIDPTHYTVTLNENVFDSQGNHFTASDVLYVFSVYATDPENSGYMANVDLEKTVASDDYHLDIYLLAPNAYTFTNLSSVRMFTQKAWEASPDRMVTSPVGTGAYTLTKFVSGSSVDIAARDDYWGAAPSIKSVRFNVISEPSQATTALETREADLVIGLQASDCNYIDRKEGLSTLVDPSITTMSMYFNMSDSSILNNLAVRKAVCYATNNQALNKVAYGGYATPAVCPFSTAMKDYVSELDHETYTTHDMEKAAAVLREAGISGGTIRIATDGTTEETTIAEVTQSLLMELGFTVEINNYDSATIWAVASDPSRWDIILSVSAAPSGYGLDQLNAFLGFLNWSQWSGPEYDAFLGTAMAAIGSSTPEECQALTNQAVTMVEEVIPTYAVVQLSNIYGFKSNLNFRVWNQSSLLVRELKFS